MPGLRAASILWEAGRHSLTARSAAYVHLLAGDGKSSIPRAWSGITTCATILSGVLAGILYQRGAWKRPVLVAFYRRANMMLLAVMFWGICPIIKISGPAPSCAVQHRIYPGFAGDFNDRHESSQG